MSLYPKGAAYIDGQIVPISEAKIPMLDWGFLHSDATYDVAHVWEGKFFRVDDYIERFHAGMEKLHLSLPITREDIKQIMHDCVRATGLQDAYVEIICTRGQPAPGSRDPRSCTNQFWAFVIPFVWVLKPEQTGLSVIISERPRIAAASVDPTIKNYHWLDLVMGLYEAYDKEAESVLLVDGEGNLCEGPGFNVFFLKGNTLSTPQAGVLQGITRKTVLALAEQQGLEIHIADIHRSAAAEADEVFVTSTAGGPMPVTVLDGREINQGEPGPITQQLRQAYWDLHNDPAYTEAVEYQP